MTIITPRRFSIIGIMFFIHQFTASIESRFTIVYFDYIIYSKILNGNKV